MFSEKNSAKSTGRSKSEKPVTTSKGSSPAGAKEEKAAATQPKATVAPAAAVVVEAKPAAAVESKSAAAVVAVEAKPAVATAPAATTKTETRDRTGVITLIAKLRDPDADTARDAASTLGNLPADAEAVTALIAILQDRDGYFHSVVRAAAAEALGKIGDRRAVDALIETTRDTMAEASQQAIQALGLLHDPRALPALEATVRNEHGFFLDHVRKTAAAAITRINAANKAHKA